MLRGFNPAAAAIAKLTGKPQIMDKFRVPHGTNVGVDYRPSNVSRQLRLPHKHSYSFIDFSVIGSSISSA